MLRYALVGITLCLSVNHSIAQEANDEGLKFFEQKIRPVLNQHCYSCHSVWLMGADNLAQFHHWQRWQEIAHLVPVAVIDRPGSTLKAVNSRAGHYFSRFRYGETEARLLARARTPAFIFLHGRRSDISSTELRRAGAGLFSGVSASIGQPAL